MTIEVIESSPVIEEVTKEFTKAKEGTHITDAHLSNSEITVSAFSEKMKSVEWDVKQLNSSISYSEVCSFYLGQLAENCSSSSLNGTILIAISTCIKLFHSCPAIENRVKAGTAGGIEAAVKAMNTHIHNPDVCENGCTALTCMAVENGIKKQQSNSSRIATSNRRQPS